MRVRPCSSVVCTLRGAIALRGPGRVLISAIIVLIPSWFELARALKWLPKAKDKSNGWTFTHPFEKMKQYQRALFWRHLFPFVWPGAEATAQAEAAAVRMAQAEGCTGDEETWLVMAGLAEAPEPAVSYEPPAKRRKAAS